jgi:HSP20 family protein
MTTLVRWEPFREVAALHNELSRYMNNLLEGDGGTTQAWVPTLDVGETDDEIVYAFDLPGISQDDVTVEVEKDTLTITAKRDREHEVERDKFYRYERRFGTFSRAVGLPQGVSEDDIKASFTDGVLEVRVPKPAQSKPRRIQVGDGAHAAIEGESKKK